jgi:hypothetical protein
MLEERLACRRQYQPVDAPIEFIELVDIHFAAPLPHRAVQMEHLVLLCRAGSFGCQTDHKAFDIFPQLKQRPLPRQVDRRDLDSVSRTNDDQCVVRELPDGLVHGRPAKAGHILQFLDRQQLARPQAAIYDHLLQSIVCNLEEIDLPLMRARRG